MFSGRAAAGEAGERIFDHALSALGLTADVCAFVGDAPHNDVFGAQNAGLFTVQFGDKAHDTISPDARIFDMAELLPTLRGAGAAGAAAGEVGGVPFTLGTVLQPGFLVRPRTFVRPDSSFRRNDMGGGFLTNLVGYSYPL